MGAMRTVGLEELGRHFASLPGKPRVVVSGNVAVSPAAPGWIVTDITAPLSRSTACSILCERCVRPSFSFVI